jgi:hypothetical protein
MTSMMARIRFRCLSLWNAKSWLTIQEENRPAGAGTCTHRAHPIENRHPQQLRLV